MLLRNACLRMNRGALIVAYISIHKFLCKIVGECSVMLVSIRMVTLFLNYKIDSTFGVCKYLLNVFSRQTFSRKDTVIVVCSARCGVGS